MFRPFSPPPLGTTLNYVSGVSEVADLPLTSEFLQVRFLFLRGEVLA